MPDRPRLSFGKKLVFLGIIAIFLAGLIEATSAVALRSLEGRWTARGDFLARHGAPSPDRETAAANLTDAAADPATEADPANGEGGLAGLHAPNWILHPYIGFVRNPEAEVQRFNGQRVDVGVNEHGFFGPSPITRRQDDTFVVMLTGGSVALELFLFGRDTLIAELEKLPIVGGRRVELVSTALGGMKQPQQVLALNYMLTLGAHYDMVINLDGFNEVVLPIAENMEVGIFPFYPRSWITYGAISVEPGAAILYGRLSNLKVEREQRIEGLHESPLRFSYLGLTFWELRQRRLEHNILALEQEVREEMVAATLSPQQRGPRYERENWEVITEEILTMWINGSVQMWRLSDALGIAYFHFLQPNQYVQNSKQLSDFEKRFTVNRFSAYGKNALAGYPVLIEAGDRLRALQAPYFDLTGIYKTVTETVYKDNCCHVNYLGNKLLAEAIAARIGGAG